MFKRLGPFAWGLMFVAAGAVTVVAATAPDPAFVYQGHIERDAQALNGPHDIVIKLYGTAGGGTAIGAPFTFNSTQLFDGNFSVAVGPLTTAQLAADPLFIEVTVDGVTLQGRQRVFATPYAMVGRNNGNFTTNGYLVVQGADFVLGTADGRSVGSAPNQRALVHDTSDTLVINYGGDFEGGVFVQSRLTASSLVGGQVGLGAGNVWPGNGNVINFTQVGGDDPYAGKIGYRVDGDNALTLVGAGTGGSRFIKLWDNVTIANRLTAPRTEAIAWCDCDNGSTVEGGSDIADYFLFSSSGWNVCRGGRFLVGFNISGSSGGCDQMHCMEQMKCCRPCNLLGN